MRQSNNKIKHHDWIEYQNILIKCVAALRERDCIREM